VVVASRTSAQIEAVVEEIRALGGKALAVRTDVSQGDDVRDLVDRTVAEFGTVDILVNNAAMITPGGPTWEIDPEEWMRTIDVNVGGCVRTCRAVLPLMIPRRRGKIINVSSGAGERTMLNWSAYCASKAAITHLTRVIADEAKPYGINVNAVGVYAVTQLWWDQINTGAAGGQHPVNLKRLIDEGRIARAEENDPVMVFLASSESDRVTGAYLSANSIPEAFIQR
jgi:NAD(P)-dependent dehydrogenase (short-subunit alcohol dehydrogenase family)